MTKAKEAQVWTVRNENGQFLGTYRALTAQSAIQRLKDEQIALASTFRRSHARPHGLDRLTASVEPPPSWMAEG